MSPEKVAGMKAALEKAKREEMRQALLRAQEQGNAPNENPYMRGMNDYMDEQKKINKDFPTAVGTSLGNLEGGALDLGRGISNAEFQILHGLGIPTGKYFHPVSESALGKEKFIPESTKDTSLAQAMNLLGNIGPTIPLGPEAKAAEALPAILEKMPQGIREWISHLSGQYGKNIAGATAAAPLYNPDQSGSESIANAATDPLTLLLAGIGPAATGASNAKQKASQFLKGLGGTSNTEKVAQNMESLKGTPAPAGEIIGSPTAKFLQSLFSVTAGSKMAKNLMNLGESFQNRQNTILGSLIPEGKGIEGKTSIPEDVAQEVKKRYSEPLDSILGTTLDKLSGTKDTLSNRGALLGDIQKDIKQNYKEPIDRNLHANLVGMTKDPDVLNNMGLYRPQLQDKFAEKFGKNKKEVSRRYKAASENSAKKGETIIPDIVADNMEPAYQEMTEELSRNPHAEIDRALYKELQDLHNIKHPSEESGQSMILDKEGKPIYSEAKAAEEAQVNARPLSSVNNFRKKYNDRADDAFRQGRRRDSAIWRKLWTGYTQDIENQLSGESLGLWKNANKGHRELLAPVYNSEELLPHALKTKSPDTLVEDILKTGDAEKPGVLKTFTSHLSPEETGKFAALHYVKPLRQSAGRTVINPKKILSQHDKLADQTRQILFGQNQKSRDVLDHIQNSFDKELYDYGSGKKPAQKILNTYAPSGAYERPDQVRKLYDILSPENKGKLPALQATRGMKNVVDPKKLLSNLGKLDPQSQEILYQQHPEVKKIFDHVFNNYDEKLYDYGKGNISSDKIISDYFPNGGEETPSKTNKLLSVLSPKGKSEVISHLLSGGRRNINFEDNLQGITPRTVQNNLNHLGSRTKQSLFRDQPKNLSEFQLLNHALGLYKDLNPMFIPKNGFTSAAQEPIKGVIDSLIKLVTSGGKKGEALLDTIGALIGKTGIANLGTRYLMSPKTIEKYLDSRRALELKNKNKIPAAMLYETQKNRSNP